MELAICEKNRMVGEENLFRFFKWITSVNTPIHNEELHRYPAMEEKEIYPTREILFDFKVPYVARLLAQVKLCI